MTATIPHLRVLTLNISCDTRGLADRLAAAAADIVAAGVDVVCLQEVLYQHDSPNAAERLAEMCAMPVVAQAAHDLHPRGFVNGVAILSKLKSGAVHTLELPDDQAYTRRAVAVELESPSGRRVVVATAHLAWGGHREPQRLAEAMRIDQWCTDLSDPSTVTVLTGDFNATPDSATVRFLTGLEGAGGTGTYWVDTWAVSGRGPGFTSTPENPWIAYTAQLVGIADPERLPRRREAFILVRGWVHGRPGTPLGAELVAAHPSGPANVVASDHYGIVTDLWDPMDA